MKKIYLVILVFFVSIISAVNLKIFIPIWNTDANNIEEKLKENFPFRSEVVSIHGYVERFFTPVALYKDGSIVARRRDGSLIIPQNDCAVDEQLNGISELYDACKGNGIKFVYINFPAQCGSDEELLEEGIYSFCDRRAGRFLEGLEEKGIDYLNLAEVNRHGEYDEFYYTDHHWTTQAGLSGSLEIFKYCNNKFSTNFDINAISPDKFKYTMYDDSWLGETGKYVGYGWCGMLDDYTFIEPIDDIQITYEIPSIDMYMEGGFDILINQDRLEQINTNNNPQNSQSLHYTYLPYADFAIIKNAENNQRPKVLLIKDSFGLVLAPFMILGSSEITVWDTRYYDGSVIDYIQRNDIDIVMVAYNEGSSIAKPQMYKFE